MAVRDNTLTTRLALSARDLLPQRPVSVTYQLGVDRSKVQGGMSTSLSIYPNPPVLVDANYVVLQDSLKKGTIDLFRDLRGRTFIAKLPIASHEPQDFACRIQGKPKVTVNGSKVTISVKLQADLYLTP